MSMQEMLAIVFGCLFAVSEVLGAVPSIKANGVFQVVFQVLGALVGKKPQ